MRVLIDINGQLQIFQDPCSACVMCFISIAFEVCIEYNKIKLKMRISKMPKLLYNQRKEMVFKQLNSFLVDLIISCIYIIFIFFYVMLYLRYYINFNMYFFYLYNLNIFVSYLYYFFYIVSYFYHILIFFQYHIIISCLLSYLFLSVGSCDIMLLIREKHTKQNMSWIWNMI